MTKVGKESQESLHRGHKEEVFPVSRQSDWGTALQVVGLRVAKAQRGKSMVCSRKRWVTWCELKPGYMGEEWETRLARQTRTRLWKASYMTLNRYLDFVQSAAESQRSIFMYSDVWVQEIIWQLCGECTRQRNFRRLLQWYRPEIKPP